MTTIKPSLTKQQVRTLLQRYFDQPVAHLTPIEGGHISRTFSFCCAADDYIIRFATGISGANFAKEAYISQRLAGTAIPVPTIVQLGRAVPHFEARIRCYQAYIGLDALRFFAKSGEEASYRWVRQRLLAIFPDT